MAFKSDRGQTLHILALKNNGHLKLSRLRSTEVKIIDFAVMNSTTKRGFGYRIHFVFSLSKIAFHMLVHFSDQPLLFFCLFYLLQAVY